ncbi:hypothetical protein SDC9_144254 [bioreactor metagenome]|uniref:Uncharacterized protein n=1 Tax=bioreactor metagenome TaxID=1076179 RepID=A0A645E695_9ZZZZ
MIRCLILLHLLEIDGLFRTGPDAARPLLLAGAEVALYHKSARRGIRLRHAVRAVHDAHIAGAAFRFVIFDKPRLGVLAHRAAHAARDAHRLAAMTAEKGAIMLLPVLQDEIAALVLGVV